MSQIVISDDNNGLIVVSHKDMSTAHTLGLVVTAAIRLIVELAKAKPAKVKVAKKEVAEASNG